MSELFLVTGATGFIASHLILQLLEKGARVRGTVRSLDRSKEYTETLRGWAEQNKDKGASIEFVECSLDSDANWSSAVEGVQGVYHVASPNPPGGDEMPEEALVRPAREGTQRVLEACNNVSNVRRVVITSSVVAVLSARPTGSGRQTFTEEDWTDLAVAGTYEKSKTIAEQTAWKFMEDKKPKFTLATVLPCYVQGPVLFKQHGTALSAEVMRRLLTRADPMNAHMPINICDVRDVAAVHIKCMEVEKAAGNRYICFSKFFWHDELAMLMSERFKPHGYSITTMTAPYWMLWFLGRCDRTMRSILPTVGHYHTYDTKKATEELGIHFRDGAEACVDMGMSLIETGAVPDKRPKAK